MTRTLILLAIFLCSVCAESKLKQTSEVSNGEDVLDMLIGGVRGVGHLARMISALSSAVEILMFVILKNVVETTIPTQIFNLAQISIYFLLG